MANQEQLVILQRGVKVWNEWRRINADAKINLSRAELQNLVLFGVNLKGAELDGAYLGGVNLNRANLQEVNLMSTKMQGAKLINADMTRANLIGVDLEEADLSGAILKEAHLIGARLHRVNFSGANLENADLSFATVYNTIFINNDLSSVKGLDETRHPGASIIDVDTLFQSKGKIPEIFLRSCGVPKSLVEYLPSLLGAMQPIQFYSCFISHSTKDHNFAQRLYDRLQGQGIRVWFAPEELKGGRPLDDQIDHAIRLHDKLILVLSDESVRSKWVMTEIRKARREELANNRRKLFPIRLTDMQTLENWECLDPETGHDLADVVRSYFIPDFSNWKDHDAFERAFTKFLDALKAVDEPPVDGQDHEKRLAFLRRQLSAKEIAKAKFGLHVPTHIELEIEDLKQEIARLEGEITE